MDLFVFGIHNADEADLREHFKAFKPDNIKIPYDEQTRKNRGYGFVTIRDNQTAKNAIQALNGTRLKDRKIKVEEKSPPKKKQAYQKETQPYKKADVAFTKTAFPYTFVKRKRPEKKEPGQFHNQLLPGHFDLAFEITWTTLTPAAMNPCIEEGIDDSCPSNPNGEYSGFSKRWLTTPDQRLGISPFTVKSAIANGFANIMGSCYRVNTRIEKHPPNVALGHYYYKGGFKRYRVAMDKSKSGILVCDPEKVNHKGKEYRTVTIKPVMECLYAKAGNFKFGTEYYAKQDHSNKRKKVVLLSSIRPATGPAQKGEIIVFYHGPYRFGMDNALMPGDLGKKYQHRFYQVHTASPAPSEGTFSSLAALKTGREDGHIMAQIDEINFKPSKAQKKSVYMGKFKIAQGSDKRRDQEGNIWYEDLSVLKENDWVYYQPFSGEDGTRVFSIGKNFQFKALFFHEDTIPQGQEECRDIDLLCPRCRLFGMTASKKTEKEKGVDGLKGRFKAAALTHPFPLVQQTFDIQIPHYDSPTHILNVPAWQWVRTEDLSVLCKQLLLPLQAEPKPNKRDVGGYFNKATGELKGAKIYRNTPSVPDRLSSLQQHIRTTDKMIDIQNGNFRYAHHLRNWAQVCESQMDFTGVVGVENASKEESAALMLLLDTAMSGHAFKLGLGKALGLGSVASRINKIWIRQSPDYKWEFLGQEGGPEKRETPVEKAIEKLNIGQDIQVMKKTAHNIKKATVIDDQINLGYPGPGFSYWRGMPKVAVPEPQEMDKV